MSLKVSNAACPLGEKYSDLYKLEKSDFDRIVTKTCTLQKISPLQEPLYESGKLYSINNFGLGNYGYKEYANYSFPTTIYTISVTGTYKEIRRIVAMDTRADFLEFNISCPNSTKKFLSIPKLAQINHAIPFGIKLPPFFDLVDIEKMGEELINMANVEKHFSYIVCCNTIPFDRGGLGGPILKPTSLYNIEYYHKILPSKIEIWGCGGIRHVDDIIEYEVVGATGVQIATAAIDHGLKYTDELIKMYREIDS